MKTHVLFVATHFPYFHVRSGDQTHFVRWIIMGVKRHTVRGKYDRWIKKIKEVQAGKAVLSVRIWSGKPYHSTPVEVFKLAQGSDLGIERLDFTPEGWKVQNQRLLKAESLATNDGLSLDEFKSWFQPTIRKIEKANYTTEPMAIIHFTRFRYAS